MRNVEMYIDDDSPENGTLTCEMTERDVKRIRTFWHGHYHWQINSWTEIGHSGRYKVYTRCIGYMSPNGNYQPINA